MKSKLDNKRIKMNAAPVSQRLRQLRKHFGYTQTQMADKLGMVKDAYGRNERCITLISTDSLQPIHDVLGVSVEWLLFGRGPMFWKDIDKKAENGTRDLRLNPEMGEMVDHMNRFSFLRNMVLGYFQKLKMENRHLLTEDDKKS